MTKKHFEEAAVWILTAKISGNDPMFCLGAEAVMTHMGRMFNPRFDVDRFVNACQPRLTKVVKAAKKS